LLDIAGIGGRYQVTCFLFSPSFDSLETSTRRFRFTHYSLSIYFYDRADGKLAPIAREVGNKIKLTARSSILSDCASSACAARSGPLGLPGN
jgi:hypothetical protein